MTVYRNGLLILDLQNKNILMRSVTSEGELDDIVRKQRVPINCFPKEPKTSVDLFTHITAGEAIQLGWGRAVRRGKGKGGRSRSLHGWLVLRVEDAQAKGAYVEHTPQKDNRHHVSIHTPDNVAEAAKHRHNMADKSNWCEHPGPSFRAMIISKLD